MAELRTVGTVTQSFEFSCGAAALATVSGLAGAEIDEARAIAFIYYDRPPRTGVSEGGERYLLPMTLEDLERGARRAGFKAASLRVDDGEAAVEALEKLAPVIARLRIYGDLLHFVVVRGAENGWVYISDPGYGNVRLPQSQFLARWSEGDGVMLAVGRRAFRASRDEAGGLRIARDPADVFPPPDAISPAREYRSSLRDVTGANADLTPPTGLTL